MNAPAAVGILRSDREGLVEVGYITFIKSARDGLAERRVLRTAKVDSNISF